MEAQCQDDLFASTTWNGADEYEPDGEFYIRATGLFAYVKWDMLASMCSKLRGGANCKFEHKYSIGHFNMVRLVTFVDGVHWVARVRMPPLASVSGSRELLDPAEVLRVEVASMKFLRSKTSIPVPEIHDYDFHQDNVIGAPYILMKYINGTVAEKLQQIKGFKQYDYGTVEQDRRFRQQMADIQATMSTFKFDRIGSLYEDDRTSEFHIGPDVVTGKGPWTSPIDYYTDLADHYFQVCKDDMDPDLHKPSFVVPIIFKHLISSYYQKTQTTFGLTNCDFGPHNILVNDDFQIVGVIDFDGVMAAPIELIAQPPKIYRPEPPGHKETRPLAIERIKNMLPKIQNYQDMVRIAEGRLESPKYIADVMFSVPTVILQALLEYHYHSDLLNDAWMEAYVTLLRRQSWPSGPNQSAPTQDL